MVIYGHKVKKKRKEKFVLQRSSSVLGPVLWGRMGDLFDLGARARTGATRADRGVSMDGRDQKPRAGCETNRAKFRGGGR